jgi:hypothetical protein
VSVTVYRGEENGFTVKLGAVREVSGGQKNSVGLAPQMSAHYFENSARNFKSVPFRKPGFGDIPDAFEFALHFRHAWPRGVQRWRLAGRKSAGEEGYGARKERAGGVIPGFLGVFRGQTPM